MGRLYQFIFIPTEFVQSINEEANIIRVQTVVN